MKKFTFICDSVIFVILAPSEAKARKIAADVCYDYKLDHLQCELSLVEDVELPGLVAYWDE